MRSSLLWLLLAATTLFAAEKVEFFATHLDSNGTSVRASGDVLVLFGDYYLSANEARYDRNTSTLELFGNIIAMQGADYFAIGDYAYLNTAQMQRRFVPFFMLDRQSDVWMSSLEAGAVDKDFTIENGMVSGCDPNDPLWMLYFSSADYNSDSRWMNVYHARFNLYGIPVFYLPYFGYSLDDRRRSGLLVPSFGVSSTEGVFYEQPLYIAVDNSWDLELRPQIRTIRGEGIYGELRFVDSNVSHGAFRTGYFKEKATYADAYDLANDSHYGFDFDYRNYAVLQRWFGWDLAGQSGLYSDVSWMNDIDYINLSTNDVVEYATSNQVLSRVNLFYNVEDVFYGMNFRYYLDLNKKSNADTLQNLPTLRYHRYMNTFLDEHVYYTFDTQVNHYFRETGKNAVEGTAELPLTFQTSLFDEFLMLSYGARFNGKYITFSQESELPSDVQSQTDYNTGVFGRIYHVLSAGSQVSRGYDGFAHTVGLDATYTKAGVDYTTGYYEDKKAVCSGSDAGSNPECGFYSISEIEESMDLKFSQFFVNDRGEQVVFHRVTQRLSFDPLHDRLSELENEFDWQINPRVSFYSDLFYNYQRNVLSKMLHEIRYTDDHFDFGLSNLYENTGSDEGVEYVNYVTLDAAYRYNRHYRYFGRYANDIEAAVKKFSEIGFYYSKRCWEFGMRYVENNRPILTRDEASSVFDKYIYFTVMFKPIGGTEVNYKLSDVLDGS